MKTAQRREFLKLLAESKTPKRRKLLTNWASKHDIDAVSEISLNTLNGNIELTPKLFKKLKKYQNVLRVLASKKTTLEKKRRVTKQSGGFLPLLIPAAIGAIANILPAIISATKKKKNN